MRIVKNGKPSTIDPITKQCQKVRYSSRAKARKATKRPGNDARGIKSVYLCIRCTLEMKGDPVWHISSQRGATPRAESK